MSHLILLYNIWVRIRVIYESPEGSIIRDSRFEIRDPKFNI